MFVFGGTLLYGVIIILIVVFIKIVFKFLDIPSKQLIKLITDHRFIRFSADFDLLICE